MEKAITHAEVVRYIELTKYKCELELKKNLIDTSKDKQDKQDATPPSPIEAELGKVSQQLQALLEKFEAMDFSVVLLEERKITDLNKEIGACSGEELLIALKNKSGKVYAALAARNSLLRQNFESRLDIARALILINRLSKEDKPMLLEVVASTDLDEPIKLACDQQTKGDLVRFLNRLSINVCVNDTNIERADKIALSEVSMVIANRKTWIPEVVVDAVKTNVERINTLSVKLQVLNAKRQVENFSNAEEEQFVAIQEEYLKLLKEQDKLLKDFSDNELVFRPV